MTEVKAEFVAVDRAGLGKPRPIDLGELANHWSLTTLRMYEEFDSLWQP